MNATYEPVLTLTVQGSAGQTREIEAVIDTGFNGYMKLPPRLVTGLGLPFASTGRAFMADGSEVGFDVHYGSVLWDGRRRRIRVNVADTTPLVGMRLPDGHSLYLEVRDGGAVFIQVME